MDKLQSLRVFCEVARCGSFVRAAMQMSLPKSTVTKHIAALERDMGAQLLKRNPKQVALTEAGERVLQGSRDMIQSYEAMESAVRDAVQLPRGAIRVGTPPSFGAHHLVQVIAAFTQRYPDIEVTIVHDDGRSDILAEALDLSIRIAPSMKDASYVALPLMLAPQFVVASPQYLKKHRRPVCVADLAQHNCLIHTIKSHSGIWRFEGSPPQEVRVRGTIRSNLGDALKHAALDGAGVSIHPTYMVADDIAQGLLEILLPNDVPQAVEINVVFSTRRNMPARVRHLLEFLKDWAHRPPPWAARK